MLNGFRDFIMRGNVVDLAVGVVIGAAFNNLVTAFTKAFLDPLVRLAGGGDVAGTVVLRAAQGAQEAIVLDYGSFITALINFLLTAAVLYFFVVQPMNRLNERLKRTDKPAVAEPSNEEKLLAEIRDELRRTRV
ncbi:large-conductance mechanosensitive channel [Deinococcus piscis]|uniref:Large-conductance mechanosensitive channel n=1 Tax=Deinococcus piscis TaxID=394230 RepID=A0ABQ3K6N9_9DEIO|nr:large conductance mechanosensitive channel protein MscL [Deinococcus piscis]GHG06049.1 large-conductance mechanosensitive channel [Deinococcus piscis]